MTSLPRYILLILTTIFQEESEAMRRVLAAFSFNIVHCCDSSGGFNTVSHVTLLCAMGYEMKCEICAD